MSKAAANSENLGAKSTAEIQKQRQLVLTVSHGQRVDLITKRVNIKRFEAYHNHRQRALTSRHAVVCWQGAWAYLHSVTIRLGAVFCSAAVS